MSSSTASARRSASASTSAAAWAPSTSASCCARRPSYDREAPAARRRRRTARPATACAPEDMPGIVPRARARRPRGAGQDRQGPEAGPRGQAPEGPVGLPALGQQARDDGPRGRPGHPAGAAPDGPARRRPVRDVGPERPLPARHQPQQPPQAAARPRRARDHRQQREADAPGGRRRPVRQRPPRAPRHRPGQPAAEVAVRHAQGQAGPLPPEPARQARGLLRPLGHRVGPVAEAPPVRPAEAHGARAVQAVHHGSARRAQGGAEHQGGQEDGRLDDPAGLGRARAGHPRAPGAPEPRADAPPPGHPGVRAGARRGQGHPGPPARLPRVQRGLRRRPDGGPPPAERRGAGGGPDPHAVLEQHPLAGPRRAAGDADAGHGPGRVLPDLRARRDRARRAAGAPDLRQLAHRREAPARVPHGAGGGAALRAEAAQAPRPGRVPAGRARGRPRAHHGRADHLQRPHRAGGEGRARRGVRGVVLRVHQPVDAEEGHRQAHRPARPAATAPPRSRWSSTRSRTSGSATRRWPASRSRRTTS